MSRFTRIGALAATFVACGNSRTTEHAHPADVPIATVVVPAVDAGPIAKPTAPIEDASIVFTADATLVATTGHFVLAKSTTDVFTRFTLPPGAVAHADADFSGVLVENKDEIILLATPSLKVLYRGKGAPLTTPASIGTIDADRTLIFARGERTVKIAVPLVADSHIESVKSGAHDTRVDVTLVTSAQEPHAFLFDIETGARIGAGIPLGIIPTTAPPGGWAGDVGFVVSGKSLSRIDLKTAKVVQKASIRCAGEDVGNPTPSANGDLVLVTCGYNGIVLDGKTLAEKRRIPNIVPGCDNGPALGGAILVDGHTLHLEGCGGEAKLDLSTGVFACADDEGLVGAPYDMGMGGARHPPAGRENVKPCRTSDDPTSSVGTSSTWRISQGEHVALVSGTKKIDIEEGATFPVVRSDEAAFAYLWSGKIVMRGLPRGNPRLEIPLDQLPTTPAQ